MMHTIYAHNSTLATTIQICQYKTHKKNSIMVTILSTRSQQEWLDPCRQLFFVCFKPHLWLQNKFSGLIMEHFHVNFGDSICTGFWDIVWKHRQTNTNAIKNPNHVTTISVSDNNPNNIKCICSIFLTVLLNQYINNNNNNKLAPYGTDGRLFATNEPC